MNTHVSRAPRAPKRSPTPRLVALRFRVVFPSRAPVPPRSRRRPPECPTARAETIDASRRHRRHPRQSRVVARRVAASVDVDVHRAQKSTRRHRRRSRVSRARRATLAVERAPVALACSCRRARVSLDPSRAREDEAAPSTAAPHSRARAVMSREGCVARRVRSRGDHTRIFHRPRRVRARGASPRARRQGAGRWGNDFTMNARARDDARCVANDARLTTMRARRTNDDASVSFFCFSPSAVVRGKKRDSDAVAREPEGDARDVKRRRSLRLMRAEVEAEGDARAKETCERSARAVAIPKPRGLAVASANIPAPRKAAPTVKAIPAPKRALPAPRAIKSAVKES